MSHHLRWFILILALGAAAVALADDREVRGTWWYVFDHVTDTELDAEIVLWARLPADATHQRVRIQNIQPRPEAIVESGPDGAMLARWRLRPVQGERQIYLRVDFQAHLEPVRHSVDPEQIEPYDTESEFYRRHVCGEPWIETDGEVARTAALIVGEETNPWRRARAVYDWMIRRLEFVPGGTDARGARETLAEGRGGCAQYAFLFTALCRSLGIPARVVGMVWLDGNRHRHAEFWVPGHGWIPVDPVVGQTLDPDRSSLDPERIATFRSLRGIPEEADPGWFFGNLYDGYFVIGAGTNVVLPGACDDQPARCIFMEPGGSDAEPEAALLRGFNPDVVHGGFYEFGEAPLSGDEAHARAHQELADRYMGHGLYDPVERGCLLPRALVDDGVTVWINMGRAYLHKGEYDRAEACFRRTLYGRAVPRDARRESLVWVHNFLGNCYDLMGRRDMALEEYRKVVARQEDHNGAVDYARTYLERPFARERSR